MSRKKLITIFLLSLIMLTACSMQKRKDLSEFPNLLLGTNNGITNYSINDNGYNASLVPDGDGIVITSTSYNNSEDGGDGYLILFYDDRNSRDILVGPAGEGYTLSFDVKTNIKNARIDVRHSMMGKKDTQIDFGSTVIKQSNKWTQVVLTGTLEGVDATSQGLFFDLRNNPAGTEIRIKNLKLIKGLV